MTLFTDWMVMSQRERDVLKAMQPVLEGKRTQAEAARLLGLCVRQVRRVQQRLAEQGASAVIHRLRGRPSNRRLAGDLREQVVEKYRVHFHDFGPTLACEKLAEMDLEVSVETLRNWLLAEGLWQRRRRRDVHRQRRARRPCFGELLQMDAAIHDWTEGRGESMVLVTMIDDASNRVGAGFYPGETVESYFDLMEWWLRRHGRPLAVYTDRDSIFQWHSKGRAAEGQTQFARAMAELDIELIWAYSPQAKGRVERFFGLAQDRWVKEMRLAGVTTRREANALLRRRLLPEYNRRFTVKPASSNDAHRDLGPRQLLPAILCLQEERVVSNDYTVRFANHCYQLHKPALPGLRGGRVILEQRRDGSLAIRFGDRYVQHHEVVASKSRQGEQASGTMPTTESSPSGVANGSPMPKTPYRPPADHPWRKPVLTD